VRDGDDGDGLEQSSLDGGAAGGVNGSTQSEIVNSLMMMGIRRDEAEMVRYYYVCMCTKTIYGDNN